MNRDEIERRITLSKQVTLPTCCPPPLRKQALQIFSFPLTPPVLIKFSDSKPEAGGETYAVKSWTKSSYCLVTNSCRRVLFSSRQFIKSTRRLVKLSRWVVESPGRVVLYLTYKSITRIFFSDSSTRHVALQLVMSHFNLPFSISVYLSECN